MRWVGTTTAGRFASLLLVAVAVILAVVVIFATVVTPALKPNVTTASIASVEAVLPREILEKTRPILAAQARMAKLLVLMRMVATSQEPKPGSPVVDVLTVPVLDQINNLINSGSTQFDSSTSEGDDSKLIRTVGESLAASALKSLAAGNIDEATHTLVVGAKLCDELLESDGSLLEYRAVLAAEFDVHKAILKITSDVRTPIWDYEGLLKSLAPAPSEDKALAIAERMQFQRTVIPMLANPFQYLAQHTYYPEMDPYFPLAESHTLPTHSSYNARETAASAGQIMAAELANTRRPWMKQEYAVEFSNKRDNDIGGWMILGWKRHKTDLLAAIRIRTQRNLLRFLLASRLYRAANNWVLPSNPSELLPYLGAWPMDLYDGKAMRYNPMIEVVYSVGLGLSDDGGKSVGSTGGRSDQGLSLALPK